MKKRNLKLLKLKKNVISNISSNSSKGGATTVQPESYNVCSVAISELKQFDHVVHGPYWANTCYA